MEFNLDQVKNNPFIGNFIKQTEKYLSALGYTDHGFRHINIVVDRARSLAKNIGLSAKEQELSAIAGYCHDMGIFWAAASIITGRPCCCRSCLSARLTIRKACLW